MRLLLVVIAIIVCHFIRDVESFDCTEGCDLDPTVNGNAVCGEDGFLYPNQCFAICQGIAVATNNDPCLANGGGKSTMNDASTVTNGFVTIDIMTAYRDDGFVFIRKVDYTKLTGILREPPFPVTQESFSSSSSTSSSGGTGGGGALRITMDGHEYRSQSYQIENSPLEVGNGPRSSAPYQPNHDRSLKVIGADSRVRITGTTTYPHNIIGAVGYNPDDYICSGTVIARSAIITAAHCVYDYKNQDWLKVYYFAPGRYSPTGADPYGIWYTNALTVLTTYTQTSYEGYDYAIVTLKKTNSKNYNYYLGDYLGYAGIAEVTSFDDALLDSSTITGYPGDLTSGRGQWKSGPCDSGFLDAVSYYTATYGTPPDWLNLGTTMHNCDTYGGMSGSSILGSDYSVRGLHLFNLPDPKPWNGGLVFKQGTGIYDDIYQWSGLSSNSTMSSPSATPTQDLTCFSSHNTVMVKDVGMILMTQLQIGDYVRGGHDDDYTQVYGFGHRNDHVTAEFLQIYSEYDDHYVTNHHDVKVNEIIPLEITSQHLLYVERNEKVMIISASDVIIGDVIMNQYHKKRVTAIHKVQRDGVYTPLTFSGNIEVSGVIASNHIAILHPMMMLWNQHMLGQAMWFPRRLFCRYFMRTCQKESYDADGYSIWASWLIRLASIINTFGWMGAWMIHLFGIPCIVIVHIIESYPSLFFGFGTLLLVTLFYGMRHLYLNLRK